MGLYRDTHHNISQKFYRLLYMIKYSSKTSLCHCTDTMDMLQISDKNFVKNKQYKKDNVAVCLIGGWNDELSHKPSYWW